ncbi:MAG: hypothetical protein CMD22_00320, partial [Flavobacteriales bacterium]|nr:hypothetical protein [Flavobacteriales bacterium]
NCYDPGTGNGQFSSLSQCQSSCIVPSWDCDGQGNCYDPGTGNGLYSSLVSCESECSYVYVYEIGLTNFKIYPNPSNNIFNLEFSSLIKRDLEIRVINSIGEIIYTENLKNHIGEYSNYIRLEEYSKSIYFLEIYTDNGIINKKLILQ